MSMDAPQLVHGTCFFVALLSDFSFQLSFETANSGMKHLVIYQHTMVHHPNLVSNAGNKMMRRLKG